MPLGKRLELIFERILFASRWLLAPFFLALAFSLLVLLLKTGQHVVHLAETALSASETSVVLDILGLVDIVLIGSLVVLVIFSGYENFVAHSDVRRNSSWPEWMATIDFSGLKLKLMSSLVAITGIQTLRVFAEINDVSDRTLKWSIGIHLGFVLATVLLALSDRIGGNGHAKEDAGDDEDQH